MRSMKSAFMFKYCILSCSFEKMIDRQNRLKTLKLKKYISSCSKRMFRSLITLRLLQQCITQGKRWITRTYMHHGRS